ncbi:MAG: DEAD/DEAH box helicase family protein [Candidatus Omnitrophica bacterium]|nr:DEAD/DEAH box helicase family protein [Candidatus Omnitrophota bacterium]
MFEPYPFQVECLETIDQVRSNGIDRALVVMATGLGKTVTAACDAKKWLDAHPGKRLLFLCHQNYILAQAREIFEAVLGPTYSFGMFTGEEKDFHQKTCIFASFQTSVIYKEYFDPDEFGYVIVDESHHSHAEGWREVVRYFTPEFILGMTATPDRLDEQNIREFFGNEIYSLPLEEALVRGYLTPVDYRLLADEVSRQKMLETPAGKLSIKYLNRTIFIPKRDEEIAKIITEHCEDIDDPRVMIFCKSIAQCNHFAEFLPSCMAIHSRIAPKERAVRLELFRAGIVKTVVTVDCFNEGIDIPQANVIVFLRSTDSPTIFMQQLGRGLRKSDGKDKVLVLDFAGNCERVEMVYKLWQKIRERGEVLGKVHDLDGSDLDSREPDELLPRGPFMIDVSSVNFSQTIIEIIDVVNRIRMGYTKEVIVEQLQSLARELGRTPTYQDVLQESPKGKYASTQTIINLFGTYNKALKAAGFRVNRQTNLDREELILQLKMLAARLGRSPTQEEVSQSRDCASSRVYTRVFGSHRKALEAAGLTLNYIDDATQEELVDQLKRLALELGKTPSLKDITQASKDGKCCCDVTFRKVFGSLHAAMDAAGLVPCRRVNLSEEELISQLKRLKDKLGRLPILEDIKAGSKTRECSSYRAFYNAFGSWSEALRRLELCEASV